MTASVLDDIDARPGSTTSLLRTLIGLYLRPLGGTISSGALVGLASDLGIPAARARTAITRLKKHGLLLAASGGYALNPAAVPMLERGDRRILTVVLGTPSVTARSQDSLQLLNWGFQNFDDVKLYGENQPGMDVRVWEGQTETVRLGPPKPVWLTVPRGKTGDIKPVAHYPDPLIAPLAKGQQVGTLDLTMDGKVVRTEPLVAQTAVERAGFFGRMIDMVKRHFSSK